MARILSLRLLSFSVLLLATAALGQAAEGRWTPFGPPTGSFVQLAPDPSTPQTIYAATEDSSAAGRIHKSLDGGRSWSLAATGLAGDPFVHGVALDPLHRGTLFTASLTAVFRTADGGAHWTKVSDATYQPAAGGSGGPILLASVAGPSAITLVCGTSDRLLRSADGGRSWSLALAGIGARFFVADSRGGLYVVGFDGRAHRTTDGGASWTDVWPASGAPADQGVEALAVDPQQPSTLYAATRTGLFASLDRGLTWSPITTLPPVEGLGLTALAVDPADPRTLYVAHYLTVQAGLLVSRDGGATWTDRPLALPDTANRLWVDAATRTLFAASERTLVASPDAGLTWEERIEIGALAGLRPARLRFAPMQPKTQWAASDGVLFTSADAGATWRGVPVGVTDSDLLVEEIAISRARSSLLFAGTVAGLLRSRDGGVTWQHLDASGGEIPAIAIVNPLTLLAGGPGVLRTTDGGASWQSVLLTVTGEEGTFRQARQFVQHPTRPATLFLQTDVFLTLPRNLGYLYSEVLRTEDGGATWTFLERALPALAFDPGHPGTILRLDSRGLYASSSLGDAWTRISDGPGNASSLVVDPASPDHLFAVLTTGQVVRSVDGGATWKPASAGLQGVASPTTLWADPAVPHLFYLGTAETLFTARFL